MMAAVGEAADAFHERSVTVMDHGRQVEFRYRVTAPAGVEPDVTYPVVLFLHGAGERGNDDEKLVVAECSIGRYLSSDRTVLDPPAFGRTAPARERTAVDGRIMPEGSK